MSVNRVLVSSSSSGPQNFTFPSNPFIFDAQDETYVVPFETIDGNLIHHKRGWDGRLRTMTWRGNPVDSNFISGIDTYFRSIEGQVRYFYFQDLDSINKRWPTNDSWKKARVIKVQASYKPGGSLRYEDFSILIQPER